MSDSNINAIITQHGLKAGDQMINIHGDKIENSVVVDNYTIIYRGDDGRYEMFHERPIVGGEVRQSFSAEAMAVIKEIAF